MKEVIKVNEEIVNDIQAKDVSLQTSKEILIQMLDMHKLDRDTSFMETPIFKAYQQDIENKRLEFDKAKDKMASEYIPENLAEKVKEWNLNYFTNELTITL